MTGLNEARWRTGMRWRGYHDAGMDENLTFVDPKTGESCALFDCMEKGNLEEQIVVHKINLEKHGYAWWDEEHMHMPTTEYREKFMKCSKCDRKHTMKKQRKWNNTQRNKSLFNSLVDQIDQRHLGELAIEEIHDMIKEMEE